jgi:hypothetical protein
MLGNRTWEEWIARYEGSHQHPVNRACHTVGIPVIAVSLLLTPLLLRRPDWWRVPALLFSLGWILQFVGHAFEGKRPEFFRDYRFLFVGLRWWFAKARKTKNCNSENNKSNREYRKSLTPAPNQSTFVRDCASSSKKTEGTKSGCCQTG